MGLRSPATALYGPARSPRTQQRAPGAPTRGPLSPPHRNEVVLANRRHQHRHCQCSTHEPHPTDIRHGHGFCNQQAGQMLLRKEVIQPHLPVRLPCYDLVLITDPTFDSSLLAVRPLASGVTDFHDLTGGVYKARERIHRSVADLRLLATPTS